MRAEIISVGTELLLGQIVDTNAAFLSKLLPELGIDLYYRSTVGDNAARLAAALREAFERADVVFTSGGLGPTEDDLTKETVAEVLGDPMKLDEDSVSNLRNFFAARGIEMPESNLKQALVPTKGVILNNPNGTAPGAIFEPENGKIAVVLPGPPREFEPMVIDYVIPYFKNVMGDKAGVIMSRVIRIAGMGESSVEDMVKPLLKSKNPTVAPLVSPTEVTLRITAKGKNADKAEAMLNEMDAKIVEILGDTVFGRDEQTMESVVVKSLIVRKLTIALAESCTGGLISNRITDVPGSSATMLMGIVSYSNNSKIDKLGVPKELIEKYGAVSEQVAKAMAEGIRKSAGSDIGVGVTGIAGPEGGTKEKPIGLVYVALANKEGTEVQRHNFIGSRKTIKLRTSQIALNMIRTSIK